MSECGEGCMQGCRNGGNYDSQLSSGVAKAGVNVRSKGQPQPARASAVLAVPQSPAPVEDINTPEWEISPDELSLGTVLGEGEFGIVYSGRWHGTPVAIKVLKASSQVQREQLTNEIEVLRKVHHPNIVQFLGACTRCEPVTMVTEVMAGGSLADALQMRPLPPLRRSLEIALDCTRGLNYLHLSNPHAVMHRDLKPSNVMLTKVGTGKGDPLLDTGVAKLADFGLSKMIVSAVPPSLRLSTDTRWVGSSGGVGLELGTTALTSSNASIHSKGSAGGGDASPLRPQQTALSAPHSAIDCHGHGAAARPQPDKAMLVEQMFKMTGGTGSYAFMAGEIFRREPYNAKADVYSLAMVLYEMLAGQRPFAGMKARSAAKRAALEGLRPQWPKEAPAEYTAQDRQVLPEVHALVECCWAQSPAIRPSCAEIIAQLEAIIAKLLHPKHRASAAVATPLQHSSCSARRRGSPDPCRNGARLSGTYSRSGFKSLRTTVASRLSSSRHSVEAAVPEIRSSAGFSESERLSQKRVIVPRGGHADRPTELDCLKECMPTPEDCLVRPAAKTTSTEELTEEGGRSPHGKSLMGLLRRLGERRRTGVLAS